jgi:hypothetical protein
MGIGHKRTQRTRRGKELLTRDGHEWEGELIRKAGRREGRRDEPPRHQGTKGKGIYNHGWTQIQKRGQGGCELGNQELRNGGETRIT